MTRILVAEDDLLTRELIRHALLQAGFDVFTAANGREALQHIAMQPPDLVLLDIFMPGIGGFEVMEQVRQHPDLRNIKIIAITGSAMAERNPQIKLADMILRKPFPIDHLILSISEILHTAV